MLNRVQHDRGFDPLICNPEPVPEPAGWLVLTFEVQSLRFEVRSQNPVVTELFSFSLPPGSEDTLRLLYEHPIQEIGHTPSKIL